MKDVKGVKDMKRIGICLPGATYVFGLSMVISAGAVGMPAIVVATQQTPSGAPHLIPRLRLEEFRARHAAGSVLVIDVRDELVFRNGHIPGAMNVPLSEIDRRASEIRTRAGQRTIVTYCSCPSEQTAASAAVALSKLGVTNVRVLVGGYPEWVSTGGAVEKEKGGGHRAPSQRSAAASSARNFRNASSDSTVITPRIR
jgi:3-mercaptopyruvate sulfurtransferase SseA